MYKKHHPPHLDDDLWRLEKIAKNGVICQRLHDRGIKTVRDLVRSYNTDPSSLLEVRDCISSLCFFSILVEPFMQFFHTCTIYVFIWVFALEL